MLNAEPQRANRNSILRYSTNLDGVAVRSYERRLNRHHDLPVQPILKLRATFAGPSHGNHNSLSRDD